MPPATLVTSGWPHFVDGIVVAPSSPTCRGNVNDYFVVSADLAGAIGGAAVVSDLTYVPHSPVRLFVRSAPRSIMVRRLAAPSRFVSSLPLGCLPRDAHDGVVSPAASLSHRWARRNKRASQRASRVSHSLPPTSPPLAPDPVPSNTFCIPVEPFSQWLCDVERDLCHICGMDERTAPRHSGRPNGPRFFWFRALGNTASPQPHTSSMARAWRSVASWCGDLKRAALTLDDGRTPGPGAVRAANASRARLNRMAATWFGNARNANSAAASGDVVTVDPRVGPPSVAGIACVHNNNCYVL